MSGEHPGERGSTSLLSHCEDPNTSQTGRGLGQNPPEKVRGCAGLLPRSLAPCQPLPSPPPWSGASPGLPLAAGPACTSWHGACWGHRGAEGSRAHSGGDTREVPPRDGALTAAVPFTATPGSLQRGVLPPTVPRIYSRVILGQREEGEEDLSPFSLPKSQDLAHFTPPQPLFCSGAARSFPTPTLQPENIQHN